MVNHKTQFITTLLFLFLIQGAYAQTDTTYTQKKFGQKIILPTSFIIAGSLLSGQNFEQNISNSFRLDRPIYIDDYLQFVPVGEMYLADLLGVKAKNHWFDQSKYLFMTQVVNLSVVFSLKYGLRKIRPNGNHHAFPSGHTSFAFASATVLQEEFRESSPLLAYSGSGFAATTGAFRILNYEHWISDVLVGAGIGILSAKLIYHFEPLKHWNPFSKHHQILVIPVLNQWYGLQISGQF